MVKFQLPNNKINPPGRDEPETHDPDDAEIITPHTLASGTEQFSVKSPGGWELVLVSGKYDVAALVKLYVQMLNKNLLPDERENNKQKKETKRSPPSSVL